MKRIYVIILLLWTLFLSVNAQSSLPQILFEIENNNKILKASKQSVQVQKVDARTGIYPSGLDVEYEQMFGNEASGNQKESELTIKQGFDFPTSYYQRNKIANIKSEQAEIQYSIIRQNILLETKQLCVELVFYNKVRSIILNRLNNTKELNTSYKKRLELGDANILEVNKIGLELLNVENEFRLNEIELNNRLKKLTELNGGVDVYFNDTSYFDNHLPLSLNNILEKSFLVNPELKNMEHEKIIADKSVSLAKTLNLPKISVGYKMNISSPEKFHGFVAGLSFPLWENKNMVNKAKAESILADLEIDNVRLNQTNEIQQLYDKVIMLKKSSDEYKRLLSTQNNNNLLKKALDLGQISLLEYLTEVNFLYQSNESSLQTERDYYLNLADLLKNDL